MKKRIKKVILLLFCILISFFVTKIKGAGIPFGSNIGGHVVGEYIPCAAGSPFCFNYVPIVGSGSSGYVQGIRVTIVNQDGAKISGTHSHDFFLDKQRSYDFLNKKGISFYSTKRHKNDIVNPGSPNIPWTSSVDLNYKSAGNYTILTNDPFPEYMGIVVANNRVLLKEYFLDRGQKKLWDFLVPTYLEPLGYDLQADIEANKTDPNFYKKRAILIEPLVWMRLTMSTGRPQQYAVDFAGTVTEVAKMISQTKEPTYSGSETFWDLFRLYDDYGNLAHYDNIHFRCETPFYRTYPLSIYCDSNEWLGGLQGVQNWVNGSYPGVYVYNDKNGVPREIPNFANEILTRNCVGAGHVWFNEIISLDCEDLEFAKNNVPLCCKELYEIHHANRDINIKNYLSPTGISCCDSLKDIIPNRLYDDNCIIETRDCDYKLDVLCPEDCFSNTEGYVKDIGENGNENEWKCIFDSKSSSYSEVKNHYQWKDSGLIGNSYCEVYCREEITYKLPGHGFTVKAGHHFTVGFLSEEQSINSWGPIEFSGFQECRTKGNADNMIINHEQFTKDYKKYNDQLPNLWIVYQMEKAYDASRGNTKTSSVKDCDNYCDNNVKGITCCIEADRDCDSCYYGDPKECVGGYTDGVYDSCKTTRNTCSYGCSDWYCTKSDTPYDHSYWVQPQPAKYGVWGYVTEDGWCKENKSGDEPEKPDSKSADAFIDYTDILDKRDATIKAINYCNNWDRDYNTFKPEIQIRYEEDKYGFDFGTIRDGIELGKLKANLVENKQQFLFYSESGYEKSKSYSNSKLSQISSWDCKEKERCVNKQLDYPINDNREEKYNKKYSYTLNNNVYRYITKPRGLSQNRIPVSSSDQYIDMGFPNLPIHYSRLPSILTKKDFYLDLRLLSFGLRNKFNDYIFKPKRFAGRRYQCDPTTTGYFDYKCNYAVDNEFMYCSRTKCKDIQIIFRPVSLSHPFLTSTGANRRPGENWHNDVEKITENRNLTVPERIYSDRDPMYEITLNTALIGQIRKYNRDARGGYSDFNLECITGEGRECKSQFIRNTFNSSFVSRWCGMSSDWDRCEKDDE